MPWLLPQRGNEVPIFSQEIESYCAPSCTVPIHVAHYEGEGKETFSTRDVQPIFWAADYPGATSGGPTLKLLGETRGISLLATSRAIKPSSLDKSGMASLEGRGAPELPMGAFLHRWRFLDWSYISEPSCPSAGEMVTGLNSGPFQVRR